MQQSCFSQSAQAQGSQRPDYQSQGLCIVRSSQLISFSFSFFLGSLSWTPMGPSQHTQMENVLSMPGVIGMTWAPSILERCQQWRVEPGFCALPVHLTRSVFSLKPSLSQAHEMRDHSLEGEISSVNPPSSIPSLLCRHFEHPLLLLPVLFCLTTSLLYPQC